MTATLAAPATLDPRPPASVRLVDGLARRFGRRAGRAPSEGPTRRSFLARAALVATALAVDPIRYLLKPGTAYAQTTGCGSGNGCGSGWTVFCVTVSGNRGKNICPPGSFAGGWWKADNSAFCKGAARYYIDCNRLPSQPGSCSCVSCYSQPDSCDRRRYCCNGFRYGQCHQEIAGITPVVCRVISCTPPWVWDPTCTTTSRTDNATATHTAPELAPVGASDVFIKYQDLGLLGSRVGAVVSGEYDIDGGRRRDFQNGSIVCQNGGAAHDIKNEVRDLWVAFGGSGGFLGYPSSDWVPFGGGARNEFAPVNATLTWHPNFGGHLVYGSIRAKWREMLGVSGPLGYPVSDEEDTAAGTGRQTRFTGGTITWRSDLASHAVRGSINVLWVSLSATAGPLGYPLTDELSMGDGRGQVSWFEGGAIFWTAATGPHHVQNPPLTFWFQQGGPRTFGYPTGNHTVFPNGTIEQRFERATVVIRDDVGTRTVIGGINAKYVELGAVGGALGVPLTDELSMGDGRGRVSWFEAGGIFWTATTGAHEVRNPILTEWFNRGGPGNPSYGYPISDVEQVAVGVTRVRFEHGTITYNSVTDSFS